MKKTPYSAGQQHLLALLPEAGGRMTTKALAVAHYGDGPFSPDNPEEAVTLKLKALQKKIVLHREKFRLRHSSYQGPYSSEWWLEPR